MSGLESRFSQSNELMLLPMEMDEPRADRKQIEERIAELQKQLADYVKKK
jgi:hypothetical protein